MEIVLASSGKAAAGFVGFRNVFRNTGVTVTVDSEQGGNEKEKAYDYNPNSYWSPAIGSDQRLKVDLGTSQPVDYFGFYATNLAEIGGSITLEGSHDGVAWTVLDGPVAPTDTAPYMNSFTTQNYRHYAVRVDSSGGTRPLIGYTTLGTRMDFETGIAPPYTNPEYADKVDIVENRDNTGQFLNIDEKHRGQVFEVKFQQVSNDWIRGQFMEFSRHRKPFLMKAFADQVSDTVVFGWQTKSSRVNTQYATAVIDNCTASISNLRGLVR